MILPVRNEAAFIERAVTSVLEAGRGLDGFEVLVVDGLSDDGTREVVEELAERNPSVRLLDNPERTVPHAMNIGIRAARGDVVIRVDGHAEVPPDFVRANLAELGAHPECACVGGVIENVNLTPLSEAISAAMSSPFGVGNATFRTGGDAGYVDTLAFGAYRKQDLERIGLFDEELVRNQDDELNFRLVRSGRKIWLSHRIHSKYFVRSSMRKLFRQYFQYGYWKVYVNRKHGTVTSLRQLVPPLFVTSLVVLLPLALVWRPARMLLGIEVALYLVAALVFALRASGELLRALRTMASFATLHLGYGLGYLAGIWDFFVLRRRPSAGAAELSR
ncbi:MAG: glycosyltransferase family 2 protein [Trueperaceae bacterium]